MMSSKTRSSCSSVMSALSGSGGVGVGAGVGSAVGAGVSVAWAKTDLRSGLPIRFQAMRPPTTSRAATPMRDKTRGSRLFLSPRAARAIRSASSWALYLAPSRVCRAMRAFCSSSGGVHPSRFTGITSSLPGFSRKKSSATRSLSARFSDKNSTRASPLPGTAPDRTVRPLAAKAFRMGFTWPSSEGAYRG